jgi:hypothetical protein
VFLKGKAMFDSDIVLDEPADFFYVYTTVGEGYSIEYLGKFKSYDAAFLASEDAVAEKGGTPLMYFEKDIGIEILEDFITFMKRKTKNDKS